MSKVSTNPPSGFRDFLPGEMAARQELVDTISRVYRAHGFQSIGLPYLESLATLQGKGGGSDNEKLIFKVMKRGDQLTTSFALVMGSYQERTDEDHKQFAIANATLPTGLTTALRIPFDEMADMGLRFDLTLPMARYCARFREQLPKPFKVFQIGPVWRADRPQKGRFREFFQCDVDIIGAKEIGAEVDCISAILEVFDAVGMTGVEVHLNDRRLLSALGKSLKIGDEVWSKCLVSLDKLDKLPSERVFEEIRSHIATETPEPEKAVTSLQAMFASNANAGWSRLDEEAFGSVMKVKSLLEGLTSTKILFNPTMIRGQDYYTGTIFEIRHPDLSGSLGGGGRYNRLMEVFGAPETPAFGGSIGFERLVMLLEEQKKLGGQASGPQIFFPLFGEDMRGHVLRLSNELRKAGLRADVFPDAGVKFGKQLSYAEERKIPYSLILGPDEEKNGQIKVKNMAARTEETVALGELTQKMVNLCK